MKDFWTKVLASLVSAALVGNTILLLDLRDRVTRVEVALTLKNITAKSK